MRDKKKNLRKESNQKTETINNLHQKLDHSKNKLKEAKTNQIQIKEKCKTRKENLKSQILKLIEQHNLSQNETDEMKQTLNNQIQKNKDLEETIIEINNKIDEFLKPVSQSFANVNQRFTNYSSKVDKFTTNLKELIKDHVDVQIDDPLQNLNTSC